MSLENLSAADQRKLTEFVDQGVAILQDIADRRDSLRDLAKTNAEHFGVKPGLLMKSIRTSFKTSLDAQKEEMGEVETILQYANRA